MPRILINESDRQAIRESMMGLSGPRAKAEAAVWADQLGCHVSRIYAVTLGLRPARKSRTDKGRRRADLKEHAGMAFVATNVVGANLDPKHAMEMARRNHAQLGFATPEEATPVSLGTCRRMLKEAGLNREQRRSNRVVHRRFEAKAPGQIFQCDVSGLKTRWIDARTRRILHVHAGDVNSNHPNLKSTRIPLWKFSVKDDHSRFLFTRFFAAEHETSGLMIDLLLEAFRAMGVPMAMYTDNASVFKSRLMQRATGILNRGFANEGGYKFEHHAPYNSNAGGKIESSHQFVEQFEKYLGIGEVPTLDQLNKFAENFCLLYNWTSHRTTREKPELRFRAGHGIMRVAPDVILNDAFKAREFEVKVNTDVTISVDDQKWQLPRSARISATVSGAREIDNPFLDLAARGRKVSIVWPIDAQWFVATTAGNEFEIPKVVAVADAAYEHKRVAESASVQNAKHFKSLATEQARAVRAGERKIIRPGIEAPFEIAAESRATVMPRRKVEPTLAEWATAAPGAVSATALDGQSLTYFAAAEMLQGEEALSNPLTLPDQVWLKSVFNGREQIAENELRDAVAARVERPRLMEVRSA